MTMVDLYYRSPESAEWHFQGRYDTEDREQEKEIDANAARLTGDGWIIGSGPLEALQRTTKSGHGTGPSTELVGKNSDQ